MSDKQEIKLFENRKIRSVWDAEQEKWYFSVVDVCGILTNQPTMERARNYCKVLKSRLKKERNETVTNCNRLKLLADDGKQRLTDEWQRSGVKEGKEYTSLTDIITQQ